MAFEHHTHKPLEPTKDQLAKYRMTEAEEAEYRDSRTSGQRKLRIAFAEGLLADTQLPHILIKKIIVARYDTTMSSAYRDCRAAVERRPASLNDRHYQRRVLGRAISNLVSRTEADPEQPIKDRVAAYKLMSEFFHLGDLSAEEMLTPEQIYRAFVDSVHSNLPALAKEDLLAIRRAIDDALEEME